MNIFSDKYRRLREATTLSIKIFAHAILCSLRKDCGHDDVEFVLIVRAYSKKDRTFSVAVSNLSESERLKLISQYAFGKKTEPLNHKLIEDDTDNDTPKLIH